ncbi:MULTISPECIES: LTA synthase family protein [Exiguobacterium]|uniref:LTA synthase family protein n=1 Tax=Exiguobacterium TaxID=33986 RepID=UPI0004516C17|nr:MULTISPECIES: LTA synthase family protein [Exiguobacterium]EZP61902.1 Sulfatase [Exiguobacterium sp. RIT341]MDQ6466060.1 LTA synthase family protein [Exiguobacterium acetylicum]MDT0171558.1 LTA synthase family protein [Exiguobacterium sp. BRG2]HAL00954.1 LTA synthase family protein [Exiguobacterium sp.]HCV54180.1 LTA synthase family protein [Exiguobacterium sp.]
MQQDANIWSRMRLKMGQGVRSTYKEHKLFWIATLLIWLKTYLAYTLFFNVPVTNSAQAFILLINPISSALFMFGFSFFFRGNVQKWFIYGTLFVATIILYADIIFFRFFNDYLTLPVLFQTSNAETVSASLASLLSWADLLIVGDLIILPFFLRKMDMSKNVASRGRAILAFVAAVVVFLGNLTLAETERPELLTRAFDRELLVKNIGTFNFHMYDALIQSKTSAQKALADSSELSEVQNFIDSKHAAANPAMFGKYKGKNVIVISFESAQSFAVGLKAPNGQEITPNLNKLIKESHSWDNFYHNTGQGKTSDAEFILENSIYPLGRGSAFFTNGENEFRATPEMLKEDGYYSAVFHANNKSFWNRDIVYNSFGVDRFFSETDYDLGDPADLTEWGLLDDKFFEQSLPMLKDLPRPFYSKFITLTNHYPFEMPKPEDELVPPLETSSTTLNHYVQALAYQDMALGKFIEGLKKDGTWDDTIFMVYGDHYGISTNHNAAMAELMNKDELTPYDVAQLQRVPFVIHLPGQTKGVKHENVASQIDIKPTLLHLLGHDFKNEILFGTDLFSKQHKDYALFRDGSVVTDKTVYTQETCYDRKTGEEVKDGEQAEMCKQSTKQSEKELGLSDKVIYGDLLRFLQTSK